MRFINYVVRSFITTAMIAGAALTGVMVGYAIADTQVIYVPHNDENNQKGVKHDEN